MLPLALPNMLSVYESQMLLYLSLTCGIFRLVKLADVDMMISYILVIFPDDLEEGRVLYRPGKGGEDDDNAADWIDLAVLW